MRVLTAFDFELLHAVFGDGSVPEGPTPSTTLKIAHGKNGIKPRTAQGRGAFRSLQPFEALSRPPTFFFRFRPSEIGTNRVWAAVGLGAFQFDGEMRVRVKRRGA